MGMVTAGMKSGLGLDAAKTAAAAAAHVEAVHAATLRAARVAAEAVVREAAAAAAAADEDKKQGAKEDSTGSEKEKEKDKDKDKDKETSKSKETGTSSSSPPGKKERQQPEPCPRCSATLPVRANFCPSCGVKIERKDRVEGASAGSAAAATKASASASASAAAAAAAAAWNPSLPSEDDEEQDDYDERRRPHTCRRVSPDLRRRVALTQVASALVSQAAPVLAMWSSTVSRHYADPAGIPLGKLRKGKTIHGFNGVELGSSGLIVTCKRTDHEANSLSLVRDEGPSSVTSVLWSAMLDALFSRSPRGALEASLCASQLPAGRSGNFTKGGKRGGVADRIVGGWMGDGGRLKTKLERDAYSDALLHLKREMREESRRSEMEANIPRVLLSLLRRPSMRGLHEPSLKALVSVLCHGLQPVSFLLLLTFYHITILLYYYITIYRSEVNHNSF